MNRLVLALSLVLSGLPSVSAADTLGLGQIGAAWQNALSASRCDEVRNLFLGEVDLDDGYMPAESVVRLLFVSAYIQGYAEGQDMTYGDLLAVWGAFCRENPDANWRDFDSN
ncbi:hypothetical protein [Marivita geojedonensis]|uniref:hypothetical protein n=1 Tax=Marivita geojedonensis TaxID=1123756 RepID=UPI000D46328E|nr:hypothetical protein [Marivita geojedonensis]PRY71857.1 hypothetical protein CLV76_13920 [Marivita geojedonensis]